VAVGDFDGDGFQDLAVANGESDTVSILLGNGDGSFVDDVTYGTDSYPSSVAIGDFDDDGIEDLAVTNMLGSVSILLGNGDGTFEDAEQYDVGYDPHSVAIGDFDGNGLPDLAVANSESYDVSILMNRTCWDDDADGYDDEACGGDDCDDTDPDVSPGAMEVCDSGIDDDCDGLVDGDDPDCIVEFTFELDASYEAGLLSLIFTIGTPEPATWSNYLVLTYSGFTFSPLWTVPLPAIEPPFHLPISFPLPDLGWIGILSGLLAAGEQPLAELIWVDTGT